MLTITNPEVVRALSDLPGGLVPLYKADAGRMTLIVKSMKEVAVTAHVRRFCRVYVVPLRVGDVDTCGLVTAFFDDHDEPLTIRTPLFDEEFTCDVFELLSSDSFDVHFFDEMNRELMAARAENTDAARFRSMAKKIRFVHGTLDLARQFHDDMTARFVARSASDDNSAFDIKLVETLFCHNLDLQSPNPGDSNEPDIERCLRRSFKDGEVYRNPVRADNSREFVDVLVVTEKLVLLIQAKDSPANEASLNRTIARKMATTQAHIRKAASQLKGAIGYLQSGVSVEIVANGQWREVSASGRELFGVVIVTELFDSERSSCSSLVLAVGKKAGVACLLLDYLELQQLTFFRSDEESLVGTLWESFAVACEYGEFARMRFGLRADGPVVYSPGKVAPAPSSTTDVGARVFYAAHRDVTIPVRRNHEAGRCTRVTSGEAEGGDRLFVVVDRTDVEAGDISRAATALLRALANRESIERLRGGVDMAFHGYSDDPRELYEIPEVRRFCAELDGAFPYWFYFLSAEGTTLGVIACCLCSVAKVRPGVVSFGADWPDFMTRHFEALNWLVDSYTLDEEQNIEISRVVTEYFGRLEPRR